jgi:biotin synthase
MIQGVKAMGLEACLTAGFITPAQAQALKEAGLDYYNHNLETSPEFYEKIVSTHRFQDRLDTVMTVQEAGLGVCCGGIVGMGESLDDRISLLRQLANLPAHPGSVTINKLIPIKGTPLENTEIVGAIDFVKVVAVARIILPTSRLRLSGGRREMSEELQVLCFLAGASSIHTGEKLLVTEIFGFDHDKAMLERLGMKEIQMQETNVAHE